MSSQLFYVLFAVACVTLRSIRPLDDGSYKDFRNGTDGTASAPVVGKPIQSPGLKYPSAFAEVKSKAVEEDESENNDESESEADAEADPIKKAGRLKDTGSQACYNELTVLGDVNDDGAFTPQEWFDMFVKLDSVSHQQNWKLSEDEWRAGLPNCDFGCFQAYSAKLYQNKNKDNWADENLDWYEWKNAMKLMDQQQAEEFNSDETDFLLEESELNAAKLSGYQGQEGVKDSKECLAWSFAKDDGGTKSNAIAKMDAKKGEAKEEKAA